MVLPGGGALLAGGFGENGAVATAYLYDAARDAWTGAGDLPFPMLAAAAGALDDDRLLVVGNMLGPSNAAVAAIYNSRARRWSQASAPPASDAFPLSFVSISRGRLLLVEVLTVGGRPNVGGAVYDPTKRTWSAINAYSETGNPGTFSVAPLRGGRALVVTQTAHVFDPDAPAPAPAAGDIIRSTSVTLAEAVLALLLLLVLGVRALRSRGEST
jgi:hypothetical protein